MNQNLISTILGWLRRTLPPRKRQGTSADILPSGLPSHVADEEPLARFLKSSKHYSQVNKHVKYAAYLPNPRNGKSSVFRHSGEPASELWGIGRSALGENVRIHGAGIISASVVRAEKLEATASEPPPRHADIEKWPMDDDPEETRAAQREVAIALAAKARLFLREQ